MNEYEIMLEKFNLLQCILIENEIWGLDINFSNNLKIEITYGLNLDDDNILRFWWYIYEGDSIRFILKYHFLKSLSKLILRLVIKSIYDQVWELYESEEDPSNFFDDESENLDFDIEMNTRWNYCEIYPRKRTRILKWIYWNLMKSDPNFLQKIDNKMLELV